MEVSTGSALRQWQNGYRCHPSSVAATVPLKQTVALQYPDRHIASAPVPSRSGADVAGAYSRRGSFPARGSNRPDPRTLCHVNGTLGLHVERYVGSDRYLVGRYARARKTLLQDRRPGDRSVRLPSNKLPEQTWRGRARERRKRQESHVLQPRHRHDGKAEACHECQARHAKVHASSHVLICERGRVRAITRRHLLLRRREPERAQTLARPSLASI